jgi:hypothetical protein
MDNRVRSITFRFLREFTPLDLLQRVAILFTAFAHYLRGLVVDVVRSLRFPDAV